MEIIKYPDRRLLAPNTKIVRLGPDEREIIKEMCRLLADSKGAGLAAPQVGWNAKLIVLDAKPEPMILWNPVIHRSGGIVVSEEGCLSLPGIWAPVARKNHISIIAESVHGKVQLDYEGFQATVIQHEVDHTNGILFIDRLTEQERARVQPQLEKFKKT